MKTIIYPWQTNTWQAWQTLIDEKRLHHAILYCAPKGSGRLAFVAMLAKTLLCTQSEIFACQQCHSCKLLSADTHPDFHHLKPEAEGKQLSVDTIRAGIKFAWQTSKLAGARVILIESADKMSEAAANALLKTLEEPPTHCHFILIAENLTNLLPTIISRCNKWVAAALSDSQVKTWIESELNQEVSVQAIRLHSGAPLAAKSFIEQGKAQDYNVLLNDFSCFLMTQKGLFDLAEQVVKREEMLTWLSLSLLDALKIKQYANAEIVHCESRTQIEQIATLSAPLLISQLRALNLLNAKLKTQTGLNTELLFSDWLTNFLHSEITPC